MSSDLSVRRGEPAISSGPRAFRDLGFVVDVACSLVAAACWYVKPELGPWVLLLLVAGRLARLLAGGRAAFRVTPFDPPLWLFLASAAMGAQLAYNPAPAAAKFWQIAGGVALAGSIARMPDLLQVGRWRVSPVRVLLAVLPAVIAVYFLLTNDWPGSTGKFAWLDVPVRWLALWQPNLPGHRLHPNVVGGMIAALLPLQLAALIGWLAAKPGRAQPAGHAGTAVSGSLRPALAAILLGLSAAGLLLTASRGAWLGLGVALLAWWLLARLATGGTAAADGKGRLPGRNQVEAGRGAYTTALPVVAAGGVTLAVVTGLPWFVDALRLASLPAALLGRLALLRNALDLALDYPFSGLGLAGFPMAYSSYVLILHVANTVHSHNLFLDVWLEQGLAGLFALLWMLFLAGQLGLRALRRQPPSPAAAVRSRPSPDLRLSLAALASLLVIALHGMVDDAFYGSRGLLLLFVPFAVLALATQPGPGRPAASLPHKSSAAADPARRRPGAPLLGLTLIALAAAILLQPRVRAALQANLGALAQTRAELAVYRWPESEIQDRLRRSGQVDLAPAINQYMIALSLDPGNAAANRRLGQIALSLGQYEAARRYLERAYAAAPGQRATRQLLGESLAIAGDPEGAAALWRAADTGTSQLEARLWWYGALGDELYAARMRAAASLATPSGSQSP